MSEVFPIIICGGPIPYEVEIVHATSGRKITNVKSFTLSGDAQKLEPLLARLTVWDDIDEPGDVMPTPVIGLRCNAVIHERVKLT